MAYLYTGVTELGFATAHQIFFHIRFPGPDAHAGLASSAVGHSSDLMAGSRRLVSRGNRCRGGGASSPDDSG